MACFSLREAASEKRRDSYQTHRMAAVLCNSLQDITIYEAMLSAFCPTAIVTKPSLPISMVVNNVIIAIISLVKGFKSFGRHKTIPYNNWGNRIHSTKVHLSSLSKKIVHALRVCVMMKQSSKTFNHVCVSSFYSFKNSKFCLFQKLQNKTLI